MTGTSNEVISNTITGVRHESTGTRAWVIRTRQLVVSVSRINTSGVISWPPSNLMVV